MARYFFHTEGVHPFIDMEGWELTDAKAAMDEAAVLHAELLRNATGLWKAKNFVVTVTDQKGLVLGRIETVATPAPAVGFHPQAPAGTP